MSDEEDDYMSEKFLTGLPEVRPSLVHNRAHKRQIAVKAKQETNNKRQREAAAVAKNDNESLQQKLSQPLSSDNKGFQLLAKMGYKAGSALGKQADARTEPIAISLKNDRSGLGRETAMMEFKAKCEEVRHTHLMRKLGIESSEEISTEAFRKRANQKAEERRLQYDMKRCQQTCESLDLKAGIETPQLDFLWPSKLVEPENDEDDVEEEEAEKEEKDEPMYNPVEQFELLSSYLRTVYQFCYWCGTHYENVEDLEANCPGTSRDEH